MRASTAAFAEQPRQPTAAVVPRRSPSPARDPMSSRIAGSGILRTADAAKKLVS